MDDDSSEHDEVDVGNLNTILIAVERGNRNSLFSIPHRLRPLRCEVEALPVAQRQVMREPRLTLRHAIDNAKCGYRARYNLSHTPWAAVTRRGGEIASKARSFSDLFTKDAAGEVWAILLPDIMAQLHGIEAQVAKQNNGPTLTKETHESALDWLVLQLADVFQAHFDGDAKRSCAHSPNGDEYYGPFVAFVLEVAKEGNFKIEPSTIHRTISARRSMGRKRTKK